MTTTTTKTVNEYTVTTEMEDSSGNTSGSLKTKITKNATDGDADYGKVTITNEIWIRTATDNPDCLEHVATVGSILNHFGTVSELIDDIKETGNV